MGRHRCSMGALERGTSKGRSWRTGLIARCNCMSSRGGVLGREQMKLFYVQRERRTAGGDGKDVVAEPVRLEAGLFQDAPSTVTSNKYLTGKARDERTAGGGGKGDAPEAVRLEAELFQGALAARLNIPTTIEIFLNQSRCTHCMRRSQRRRPRSGAPGSRTPSARPRR